MATGHDTDNAPSNIVSNVLWYFAINIVLTKVHNDNNFFLNFILIYKINKQIQISLIIGNLYLADLITGISSIKMNE